ncbi:MAG TPA: PLP-dependent aminotransferase family protein [Streptosporangiaceae bacterium]|nr:PLP-dependent aminotransferase family protein [Streptosporangiaceae bacterium]
MSETWANPSQHLGFDLHLELAGSRVRAAMEAALREAVRSGRLAPGVRLPSSRDLAADLGVARNTVADAYGQLVAEGWFEARTGAGTWVAERPVPAVERPAVAAAPRPADPRYDLRAGIPAVAAFPRRAWLAAGRAALAAAEDNVLGYPDPRGLADLRVALAGYLGRARGVLASPENVVICSGFAHGLAVLCRVLSQRGRPERPALAIEAYGHALHRRIAAASGMRIAPLPVDASGALDAAAAGSHAMAAVLTPAHQYPLGMTLAPARRTAFVRWAASAGAVIIEDDYDGEFRFDRQPVGAMQALAPEHVVYAGTASKSLAPGLRLGWLVVPDSMVDDVVAAKEMSGGANGTLEQLTLAAFIESGGYDRQIRQSRLVYRRRRDRLIAALRRAAPAVRLTGIAAGLHALAELPGGVSEEAVVAAAARHGVAVDGLRLYTAPGHERGPALVIGYGRPAEHAFTTAVGRLCAALAETT